VIKFKDVEAKYKRNVDEWLCNLYIESRQIELLDFKMHKEKIEFRIPREDRPLQKQLTSITDSSDEEDTVENEGTMQKPSLDKRIDYEQYRYAVN